MTPTGERVEPKLPAAEILDHVIAGRRVALVDVKRYDALLRFADVIEAAGDRLDFVDAHVHRGHDAIDLCHPAGGQLVPGCADDLRGRTFDVAYAAVEVRRGPDVEVLVPVLASTNGEIVWWER